MTTTNAAACTQSRVARLYADNFRCLQSIDVALAPGLTVFHGANGQGKTSLLEATGWASAARSLRHTPDNAVVRSGCDTAVVREEIEQGERRVMFEAEIRASGRNRMLVNRKAVQRTRDLFGVLRTTVFSPDDLALVKASPQHRRTFIDELLAGLSPRYVAALSDFERVLRQRNALLRGGARHQDGRETLAAFDEQLVAAATEIVRGRLRLLDALTEPLLRCTRRLSGRDETVVGIAYTSDWSDTELTLADVDDVDARLRDALERTREHELDRAVTLVGPHRDDLVMTLNGLDARVQASQGEQRTLALALRLAGHEVTSTITATVPVLLLDDVFSELDATRAEALLTVLPPGQTLLTTAGALPSGLTMEAVYTVDAGRVVEG
ncbi:MAG TPA: DNA replication/repair protein RecF [Acidimicrobiia bacterium]